MREIKFRAWDKYHKQFISNRLFCVRLDGKFCLLRNDGHWCTQDPNNFILMQYSGLKDKHGKGIYEGDIVKLTALEYFSSEPVSIEEGGVFVGAVKFMRGCWEADDGEIYIWLYADEFEAEIIGSIYENPELYMKCNNKISLAGVDDLIIYEDADMRISWPSDGKK